MTSPDSVTSSPYSLSIERRTGHPKPYRAAAHAGHVQRPSGASSLLQVGPRPRRCADAASTTAIGSSTMAARMIGAAPRPLGTPVTINSMFIHLENAGASTRGRAPGDVVPQRPYRRGPARRVGRPTSRDAEAARGGRGGFPPRTSTEHGCGVKSYPSRPRPQWSAVSAHQYYHQAVHYWRLAGHQADCTCSVDFRRPLSPSALSSARARGVATVWGGRGRGRARGWRASVPGATGPRPGRPTPARGRPGRRSATPCNRDDLPTQAGHRAPVPVPELLVDRQAGFRQEGAQRSRIEEPQTAPAHLWYVPARTRERRGEVNDVSLNR